MARRTSRRPRVVWLPQDPFFSVDAAGLSNSQIMAAADTIGVSGNAGERVTIVAPVVRDVPINPLTAGSTLADIENSGYRLRRIVGKFWCGTVSTSIGAPDGSPKTLCTTAGFIVLRCDDQGLPLANVAVDNYNTQIIENTENPWIWRRSWIYGVQDEVQGFFSQSQLAVTAGNSVSNNVRLAGVADGPHIDQKTARIVGPDERLFLVISTTVLEPGTQGLTADVRYFWELRVLASMRSMVGNRRNASR